MTPFPDYPERRLLKVVQVADILLTEGHVRASDWAKAIAPPPWPWSGRYWRELGELTAKRGIYEAIRKYQKDLRRINPKITHARQVTYLRHALRGGQFWEWTYPRAKYGDLTEIKGKRVTICRPTGSFDVEALLAFYEEINNDPDPNRKMYDLGELVRIAGDHWAPGLVDLLKIDKLDKIKRWVCSTGIGMAMVEKAGWNMTRRWEGADPAWLCELSAPTEKYVIDNVIV